jgi:hypothetical protein
VPGVVTGFGGTELPKKKKISVLRDLHSSMVTLEK